MAPGPADVELDIQQPGHGDLGGKLAGDGPARFPISDDAELLVEREAVHLHDHAIGVEGEVREEGFILRDPPLHGREIPVPCPVRLDRKTPGLQLFQHFPLVLEGEFSLDHFDMKGEHPEPPSAGDPGIELAQAAGRGIPRIGERRLALALPVPVEPRKGLAGEVDLATDLHQRGMMLSLEDDREFRNGLQVLGDDLAERAIAPGGTDRETPLPVGEAHCRAVNLHFGGVPSFTDIRHQARIAVFPLRQILGVEGIGERKHPPKMTVLGERGGWLGAGALGGTVWGTQSGVLGLDGLQLSHPPVVFGVGDLRRIENVVDSSWRDRSAGAGGRRDRRGMTWSQVGVASGRTVGRQGRPMGRPYRAAASCCRTVSATPDQPFDLVGAGPGENAFAPGPFPGGELVQQAPEKPDQGHPLPLDRADTGRIGAAGHPLLQPLEPMGVAECLGGQACHHLAEANVGLGEGWAVPEAAQEDGADRHPAPGDRHHGDRAHPSRIEGPLEMGHASGPARHPGCRPVSPSVSARRISG